jgi:hypothetical protein
MLLKDYDPQVIFTGFLEFCDPKCSVEKKNVVVRLKGLGAKKN